jgi:hypothetical protein
MMPSQTAIAPELETLTRAIQRSGGKLRLPEQDSIRWYEAHKVTGEAAKKLATHLMALALSLLRTEKERPDQVLAALYLLVAAYVGKAAATKAFKSVGWSAPARPAAPAGATRGWGR